jgi:hypothetical protein
LNLTTVFNKKYYGYFTVSPFGIYPIEESPGMFKCAFVEREREGEGEGEINTPLSIEM